MLLVITSPRILPDETSICNLLFDRGLEILHLRKPQASVEVYEQFIQKIRPCYHSRIVIHDHYKLAKRYPLRGIHLKSRQGEKAADYPQYSHISISCHSLEEIRQLPFKPTYCFLSPVFDSLSKTDYRTPFSTIPDINKQSYPFPVIALGGITPDKIPLCRQHGFKGAAVLGYIWEKPEEAVARFMYLKTPFVLSIAGFDPSAGAGVTADLKTFEKCSVYGLGVTSALTFQNEQAYRGTQWVDTETILRQCDSLIERYRPEYIKIGLIRDIRQLDRLLSYFQNHIPEAKIIWDPILKASSGFLFHTPDSGWLDLLKRIYLLTPNTPEVKSLFGTESLDKLREICGRSSCNILWKGGHNTGLTVTDQLVTPDKVYDFSVHRSPFEKHGTGCLFSSAATAWLAQGFSLSEACSRAQLYVAEVLASSNSKLGFHFLSTSQLENIPLLYDLPVQYLTDFKEGMTVSDQIEAVCRGGIRWIQLRMKEASDMEILRVGKIAKEICKYYRTLFIIDDKVELARELDADGVHLGKEDMDPLEARKILGKSKIIGATCNTFEDIKNRSEQKVDYIGLGPFRFTSTKKKLSPVLGLEGYRQIQEKVQQAGIHIPIFAIGGITTKDIRPLLQTGIQGIALSGAIKNSPDLTLKTREILSEIENSRLH